MQFEPLSFLSLTDKDVSNQKFLLFEENQTNIQHYRATYY